MNIFSYLKALERMIETSNELANVDLTKPDPENSVKLRQAAAAMLDMADAADAAMGTPRNPPHDGGSSYR